MGSFIRIVIAACLVIMAEGATTAFSKEVVVIAGDYGGKVRKYVEKYDSYRDRGVQVRITGTCLSACTLVLMLPPDQICIDGRARLAFHAIRDDGEVSERWNRIVVSFYPDWAQDWIAVQKWPDAKGGLGIGFRVMGFTELAKHYKVCETMTGQRSER